jgi:hypothetical protein
MRTEVHKIKFEGLPEENGSISLQRLLDFYQSFSRVAEGALLSYVTGSSKRKGKSKDWLTASMDFKLKGIHPGSTIIDVEAPVLMETLNEVQTQMFHGEEMESIGNKTAIELGVYALEQALDEKGYSPILDKHLLIEMEKMQKFFSDEKLYVTFSDKKKRKLKLNKEDFTKIISIEQKTPEPFKTKITGKLDVLKHTQGQLELVVQNKRIKCIPPPGKVEELISFFGKTVSVTGIINFNPSGEITAFEIQDIKAATGGDEFFKQVPKPRKEFTSLEDLAKEQGYKKPDLDKLIGTWSSDIPIEELLKWIDE